MQQLSLRPNSHSKGVPWCHTWYSLQINVLHPQNPILHHPFCNSSARTGGFDTTRDDSSDGRHPESSLPLNESNSSSLHRFRFGGGDGSFLRASNSSSSSDTSSWSLMGRVVDSSQLQMGSSPRQRLVLLAAARHAGVSELDMVERVKELATLLPDLTSMFLSLSPATLAALASDTTAVAHKLIQLRLWFPTANVAAMVGRRPTLLLDEQWVHVDSARLRLLERLLSSSNTSGSSSSSTVGCEHAAGDTTDSINCARNDGDCSHDAEDGGALEPPGVVQTSPILDGLVSRQPLLLVDNVDELLDELTRLLPSVDVVMALQRDPDLVTSVMCNRRLSIW